MLTYASPACSYAAQTRINKSQAFLQDNNKVAQSNRDY